VNAAIVSDDDSAPVNLVLDDLEYNENIKKKIVDEFEIIVKKFKFNKLGSDYFRRWYIDGRIYFHLIVDSNKQKGGILDIVEIDPLQIKKVKEITTSVDAQTGAKQVVISDEYFVYSDTSAYLGGVGNQLKISLDSIVCSTSGLLDENRKNVVSHLHKCIKLINNLRRMEDSLVIYRITRAPERRIFYIDVGNLPKGKSEEYVQSIMSKYRNKLVYDAETGDIRDDRKSMSMLEDFWLPRKEGGKGTEITTLPGGENLGQIEDVLFFQKKLYKALNVPISRLESETGFNIGRATEISRDEVTFHKFITRLRKQFSSILIDALKVQLLLKGIVTEDDWDTIKEDLAVDFAEDNFFNELKDNEILKERINLAGDLQQFVGKYYSNNWIRTNILRQSQQDIERIDKEISDEAPKEPAPEPEEEENDEESQDSQ
jgi:hypothetical protein